MEIKPRLSWEKGFLPLYLFGNLLDKAAQLVLIISYSSDKIKLDCRKLYQQKWRCPHCVVHKIHFLHRVIGCRKVEGSPLPLRWGQAQQELIVSLQQLQRGHHTPSPLTLLPKVTIRCEWQSLTSAFFVLFNLQGFLLLFFFFFFILAHFLPSYQSSFYTIYFPLLIWKLFIPFIFFIG